MFTAAWPELEKNRHIDQTCGDQSGLQLEHQIQREVACPRPRNKRLPGPRHFRPTRPARMSRVRASNWDWEPSPTTSSNPDVHHRDGAGKAKRGKLCAPHWPPGRATTTDCGDGLRVDGTGGSGAINVVIADSSANFNAGNGIDAVSGPGNANVDVMRVVAASNGSAGIQSNQTSGGIASVTVGSSLLRKNAIGIQATSGASLLTYGNNHVTGNASAASPAARPCSEPGQSAAASVACIERSEIRGRHANYSRTRTSLRSIRTTG